MAMKLMWILFSVCLIQECFTATDFFYTAAVFEHASVVTHEDMEKGIVETNLAFLRNAAQTAKLQGADIVVYPEYGVFPPIRNRPKTRKFLEDIPDPKLVDTIPCLDESYSEKPILHTMSCVAKNNSMFVVVNMGDIKECEGDPNCPPDGAFQYNTNVVFNRDGKMLVRYHKENLFFETGMDEGEANQNTVFETDFGTFATYICFDITFERMDDIARYPNVDAVAFSTKWLNIPPQLTSVQLWLSWALRNKVVFLGSNIHLPGHFAMGSGVFHPREGALAYTFNPDGISKLLVSKVPRTDSETFSPDARYTAISETDSWEYVEDGKDVPVICTPELLPPTSDNFTEYRCFEEDTSNYTFVKLTDPSGHLEVCDNGMCCTLDYSAEDMAENFYFGIINETYFTMDTFYVCEETCLLARCEALGDNPCAFFPQRSETIFHYVHLKGKFTTDLVYPSVVESKVRLTPMSEWTYELPDNSTGDGEILYNSEPGRKLITLGLKGRCVEREPVIEENWSLLTKSQRF